ncbi:MAG: CNNM domain-containing protein, partial [Candidatus Omnitrophica bacterium]|nr:CNNM domain-containing protein [Candidatus Omnitrophota bacterium]
MEKIHQFFWPLCVLAGFVIRSCFCSMSETALISLSKIRLRHLVDKGVKNAKVVQNLVSHLDRLITTILVGNNIVNIGISAIGTAIFIYLFGPK